MAPLHFILFKRYNNATTWLPMITQEIVKELLDYNPLTGIVTWRTSGHKRTKGAIAGSLNQPLNRYYISIHYKQYALARVIWLYYYGIWAKIDIDHINQNPLDNRIENLRTASRSLNCHNSKISTRNTSGHKGVSYCPRGQYWISDVTIEHCRIQKYFKTKQEAIKHRQSIQVPT
jgi:hypothetical protein